MKNATTTLMQERQSAWNGLVARHSLTCPNRRNSRSRMHSYACWLNMSEFLCRRVRRHAPWQTVQFHHSSDVYFMGIIMPSRFQRQTYSRSLPSLLRTAGCYDDSIVQLGRCPLSGFCFLCFTSIGICRRGP